MLQIRRLFWRQRALTPDGFLAADQGAALPTIAFVFVVLLLSASVSVDLGRAYLVRAKLQSAVDAAGLAAGSSVDLTTLQADAVKYLHANFDSGDLGSEVTVFDVVASADQSTITLSATAQVPMTFMTIFGKDFLNVGASAEITRLVGGMEVAMALDVTGSMKGAKIAALRTAAQDLVDILFGSRQTVDNLWVGVVPFSQAVNVGPGRTGWVDSANMASHDYVFPGHAWGGCMEERFSTRRDTTDDGPDAEKFHAYFYADTSPDAGSRNSWKGNSSQNRVSSANDRSANRLCPSNPVTILSNSKNNVTAALAALGASVPRGYTHVNIGAAWGWRLLSPKWRGQWGGDMDANNLPLDYSNKKSQKAIVLMTDGANTYPEDEYTAFGFLADQALGTASSAQAVLELNARLEEVCTSMKSEGILVYSILFDENDPTIVNLMRNCASKVEFFFQSPDAASLQAAFQAIGTSLSQLRVSR